MLSSDKSSAFLTVSQSPVKTHEIIFVWLFVMVAWNGTFTHLNHGIQNLVYLQWGGIAMTMIALSKYFIRGENLTFSQFVGERLSLQWMPGISIALLASVIIGIASWGALVFLTATIHVDWAYNHWQLITAAEFQEIKWKTSWLVIDALCGIVLVPITEEIVFRGFVLRRLREKYRVEIAVVVSSILFAIVHFDKDFLGAFLMGIILAVLALRFSSLYAPMIVHGIYNAIVSVLQRGFGQFMVVDKNGIDSISYWMPEIVVLSICTIAVFAYLRFGLHTIRLGLGSQTNDLAAPPSEQCPIIGSTGRGL